MYSNDWTDWNEFDLLIQDIEALEELQQIDAAMQGLTAEIQYDEDLLKTPFPGFSIPEGIIPSEINIPLNPLAWALCDNGIGELIKFVKNVVKEFMEGVKFLLDGVVGLVKLLVNIILDAGKEFIELLKYTVDMLKRFYCESQHIRLIIAKAAPVTRTDAGLPKIKKGTPKPKTPVVYPTEDEQEGGTTTEPGGEGGGGGGGGSGSSDGGQQQFPDATALQVYSALLELRDTLLNKAGANLLQTQENQNARYEDLRRQLIQILPVELRSQVEEESIPQTEEEKAKAEKEKYLDGLEDSIKALEKQLSGIAAGQTITTIQVFNELTLLENNLNTYNTQSAIADLPPLDPLTPDVPYDVTPDPRGVTYRNLLQFVERLIQKTATETISNNVIRLDSNNRAYYQSLRKIIEAVRDISIEQRRKLEQEYQAKLEKAIAEIRREQTTLTSWR